MSPAVGIVANPAAGKDVRRLVSHAAPVSDAAKVQMVRRVAAGAVAGGAERIVVAPDGRGIGRRAFLARPDGAHVEVMSGSVEGSAEDTLRAVDGFVRAGVDVVVVLGGDGTIRDVARTGVEIPVLALSTGTNNVFPWRGEPTLAGWAAGLVASRRVDPADALRRSKVVHLDLDGTEELAVVEAALVGGRFVGSRAVWEPSTVAWVVAAIAEPATIGLSSIAAAVARCGRADPGGVVVRMGDGEATVTVPLAPGSFSRIERVAGAHLDEGCIVELGHRPGVLALDGERTRVLDARTGVAATVRRDGPVVVDVEGALAAALPGCATG